MSTPPVIKRAGKSVIHHVMSKHAAPVHSRVAYLNESGWFAAVLMILLNLGSKYITVHFSPSAEEYFRDNMGPQVLIFAISWLGSRDIYTAVIITSIFVLLSSFLFNYDSQFCIIPQKYRKPLTKKEDLPPTDEDAAKARELLDKYHYATQKLVYANSFPYDLGKNNEY
jgi:hypothetical protein